MKKLLLFLLLVLAPFAYTDDVSQVYEGTTVAVTAVTADFSVPSKIIVIKAGANELYVKFGNTDITAGMIDTAANRQTNAIWTVDANTTLTLDNIKYSAMSWMTTTAETTVYRVQVIGSGGAR